MYDKFKNYFVLETRGDTPNLKKYKRTLSLSLFPHVIYLHIYADEDPSSYDNIYILMQYITHLIYDNKSGTTLNIKTFTMKNPIG